MEGLGNFLPNALKKRYKEKVRESERIENEKKSTNRKNSKDETKSCKLKRTTL